MADDILIRSGPPGRRPLSRRRRVLFASVYVVWVLVLVSFAVKVFWRVAYDVPLTGSPGEAAVWRHYYPELWSSGAIDAEPAGGDDRFDVLLLGGSVLEQVAGRFEQELRERVGHGARVYNLARSAHTSRDSYLKHSRLEGKAFEPVVVYHGINDVRMNCCPEPEFRDDYTHCAWYAGLQRRVEADSLSLSDLTADRFTIPLGAPDEASMDYGATIKTAGPFRRNLESIVRAAEGRPVVLMTFAYHIPPDYTREKFESRRHELDYGRGVHELPAEVWGRPEHVAATIDAHNRAIRELAEAYDNVIFINQEKLLPADGRHFSDPCHLTEEGCRAFVENALPAVVAAAAGEAQH